jgi:hypothetical protein
MATDKESDGSGKGKWGCAALGLFLFLGFCVWNLPRNPPEGATTQAAEGSVADDSNPYADVSKQEYWIIQSKDTIRGRLRDPGSAEFRNLRFYSGGDVPVTCGEVNAKNAFGGYTGFERFIAAGPNTDLAFTASDFAAGDSIDNVWDRLCVRADGDEAYVP